MSKRTLLDRQKAINKTFFPLRHRSVLKPPTSEPTHAQKKRALTEVSDITNGEMLDRLIASGIDQNTLSALTLIPLIEVAWADDQLDAEERGLVLAAAKRHRFNRDSYTLLKYWLEHPSEGLMEVWRDNVEGLLELMSDSERSTFCADIFGRAKEVAEATGGVLGIGKISKLEREVLVEIESVFA